MTAFYISSRKENNDIGNEISVNVRAIHKILNCALNQAVRWELLETNPVSKATLPKFEKKVRDIWTMEDLTTALEVCEDDRLALGIFLPPETWRNDGTYRNGQQPHGRRIRCGCRCRGRSDEIRLNKAVFQQVKNNSF